MNLPTLVDRAASAPIPITVVTPAGFADWRGRATPTARAWAESTGFLGEAGSHLLLPGADGRLAHVVLVVAEAVPVGEAGPGALWDYAALPGALPAGDYAFAGLGPAQAGRAALAWALGAWSFRRYRTEPEKRQPPHLVWPDCDRAAVSRLAIGVCRARDLVTTPAEDMGPAELEEAVRDLADLGEPGSVAVRAIVGDELLSANWPSVHRVGRASTRPPRLIELHWAPPGLPATAPRVTLVGKGVCFDSGGLDLKASAMMKLMKKDMGGAAITTALAGMVIDARLPVRLRLLVPAVDNMVSGNAMKPLDVIRTRSGLTVEIGNTDAEGRLILCDALHDAVQEKPDLLLDVATLTGAARVALGPDLPALFTDDDALADEITAAARRAEDPLWRLPLWAPYAKGLESKVADLNSIADSPFNGAITAALYLKRFVGAGVPWAHLDVMAWNPTSKPGRPEGGEATGLRALWALLQARYGGG